MCDSAFQSCGESFDAESIVECETGAEEQWSSRRSFDTSVRGDFDG
jgi:hypothetical protein